jgi:hypothetical protein
LAVTKHAPTTHMGALCHMAGALHDNAHHFPLVFTLIRLTFFFFFLEGVYIQQGRKRTSEHHPRGTGGGAPPRLIIESIRIAVEAA